jgi:uncharacterized protein YkwD
MRIRSLAVALALTLALLAAAPAANAACSGENDPVTSSNIAAAEASMVCLVNEHRQANGQGALTVDSRLSAAARSHSEDMVARNFFSHDTPDGVDPFERIAAAGYPIEGGSGENIAVGSGNITPKDLFTQFRNSPGHNNNMLSGLFRAIGVGFATPVPAQYGDSGATVTQTFGAAEGDGIAGSAACTRVVTLEGKVKRLKQKITNSSGSKRTKAKKALKKVKKKLRAARAECG